MDIKIPFNYQEIVDEIVQFTALPKSEVEEKVRMEASESGCNVKKEAKQFGVTPHEYNEKMQVLYQQGYGFLFETLVFWLKAYRQCWIQEAMERIHLYAQSSNLIPNQVKILMFGDGSGNDSLYLVKNGFNINYFDFPGSKTYDFATKRFTHYNLLGNQINLVSDYNSCLSGEYDVVLSFEVLEHLTDPVAAIKDIYSMLKLGGIALITESFALACDPWPTHLKSNLKFAGETPFLFLNNKILLSWHSRDSWLKPMEFTKVKHTSINNYISLLGDSSIRQAFFAPKKRALKASLKRLLPSLSNMT